MGYKNLEELISVIRRLRAPDGCQWDREQTHQSLKPNMLEEAYEAIDAINSNDMKHLKNIGISVFITGISSLTLI